MDFRRRTVILVDDGIATGANDARVSAVRRQRPDRVIVATPIATVDARNWLGGEVDDVVCLATPEPFYAVGAWYEDFPQVSDQEVRRPLAEFARRSNSVALDTDHRAWSFTDDGIDVRSHSSEQLVDYATANHNEIALICFGGLADNMRHVATFQHRLHTRAGFSL